ncbi:hypothetical protein AaE_009152 [Aphanomyces astaci]|uniref:AB hydrolase-1 domain-containing protein n=1 Tax=Aphanomyces astaci TaxID=112090 RepID=A0A6A5A408_APHAT|nr:hypothetical protein AaE_009152 [Aphanomyces astaci]
MPTFTTSDSCVLAYEDTGAHAEDGTQLPVLLLLHGWSGSRRYFSRNVPLMQPHLRVICLDLRFHGESQGTAYGMHIARLAVDVHEFITVGLKLSAPVTLLGTSMGCAVIWSLFELFGTSLARQAIFVDQALETTLTSNLASVAQGNLASCLVRPNDVPPAVLDHLAGDVLRCNPTALATLMRDHTQIDWRSLLPTITIPCLNIVGGPQNKVFPMDGALHVGRLLPHCVNVVFESCGHWLYLEQPDEFSALVTSFVRTGNVARTFLDDAQKPNAAIYVVDR